MRIFRRAQTGIRPPAATEEQPTAPREQEEDLIIPGKLSADISHTPDPIDLHSKGWVARVIVGSFAAIALMVTVALLYYLSDIAADDRIAILQEILEKLLLGLVIVGVAGIVGHYFHRRK